MDHQWLAALTRGPDMRAKTRSLPLEISREPVIVEPCFTNGNNFRLARQLDQLLDRGFRRPLVIRMHADTRIDVCMLGGNAKHRG